MWSTRPASPRFWSDTTVDAAACLIEKGDSARTSYGDDRLGTSLCPRRDQYGPTRLEPGVENNQKEPLKWGFRWCTQLDSTRKDVRK
jgi:hypothetical protein